MSKTLIYNARLVDSTQDIERGWLVIDGPLISDFGNGDFLLFHTQSPHFSQVIDAHGAILMPGIIDEHVHFREPGMEEKGNIESESMAAAAGGVTSFFDMPNTHPATITLEAWEQKMGIASIKSLVNYTFFIGATPHNLQFLEHADFRYIPGIKLFMGTTTGTTAAANDLFLDDLFRTAKATIAVHAEDDAIIQHNIEKITALDPDPPVSRHPLIRSAEACEAATAKITRIARKYNRRLHLMHISTARELHHLHGSDLHTKLITAETCPQYLFFSHKYYGTLGTRIKCNPAIKEQTDRDALRHAVFSGLIDTVATDHAPHRLSDKNGGALKAASGMPGVQFALPLMLTLAQQMNEPFTKVSRLMSGNPAIIWNVKNRGFIRKGFAADLTLVKNHTYCIDDSMVLSKCRWTPYAGISVSHKVISTWVNGNKVFDAQSGTPQFNICPAQNLIFDNP